MLYNIYKPLSIERGETDQLLIGYQKPHKPVSTDTIARWIKNAMGKVGIDTSVYKAHSTRAAATSAAKGKQVPIDTILSAAGWSSESTFARFYDKPIKTLPQILDMNYCIVAVKCFLHSCINQNCLPYCYSGFVRVMENLESHGILEFDFPGLESHGN